MYTFLFQAPDRLGNFPHLRSLPRHKKKYFFNTPPRKVGNISHHTFPTIHSRHPYLPGHSVSFCKKIQKVLPTRKPHKITHKQTPANHPQITHHTQITHKPSVNHIQTTHKKIPRKIHTFQGILYHFVVEKSHSVEKFHIRRILQYRYQLRINQLRINYHGLITD